VIGDVVERVKYHLGLGAGHMPTAPANS